MRKIKMINKTFFARFCVTIHVNGCCDSALISISMMSYVEGLIQGGYISNKLNRNEHNELLTLLQNNNDVQGTVGDLIKTYKEWYEIHTNINHIT